MKYGNVNKDEATFSRTSTSLLRKAQANDGDAWTRLVNTYGRRIYRWCRRSGLQPADASNVVQEVLRAVARKLSDFQHDRHQGSFRGWIRRITQNKLLDHYRRQSRTADRPIGGTDAYRHLENLSELTDDFNPPPSDATGPQATEGPPPLDNALLDAVRSEFSERDWRFFWRVAVDGQSAVEVGEEFGVTANTVRIVKMRVLRRLREKLGEPPRT